ncbi:MAG: hypothetical protein EXR72_06475 [Myxococcales bacterium]|nr:hypothetical protein [Myxococcales bacterium]
MKTTAGKVALIGLLAACGPAPHTYPGPPEVTLGTGVTTFVPVGEGADVPIIMGIQGGYHIWGSVRARYMEPQQIHLLFTLTFPGGEKPFSIRHDTVDLTGTRDGLDPGEHIGSAVFLPDVVSVRGQPCLWRLEVTDTEKRTAKVERMIHPL